MKIKNKCKITKFQEKVFLECRKIPKGKVTTYNKIAKKLKSSPRAVGQALKNNPFAPKIPCHRIINSNGTIGGYKGKINNKRKLLMLKKEGIIIKNKKVDKKYIK